MLKETVESYLGREINLKVKTRMNKPFWKACAVALLIILYLFALNGRYEFNNNVINDKWKKQSMTFVSGHAFEWGKWTVDPRNK